MPPSGRWLSYVTSPLFVRLDVWTVLFINIACWSLGCVLVGRRLLASIDPISSSLIALLLAACPAYWSLLQWPYTNALISIWFLLSAASLGLERLRFVAYALLVAGAILIYQPLAILLLAIEICNRRAADLRGAFEGISFVLVAFVSGGVLGVLIQNALNYWAFGHFGLVLEGWRQVTPIVGFQSVIDRMFIAVSRAARIGAREYWGFLVVAAMSSPAIWFLITRRASGVTGIVCALVAVAMSVVTIVAIGVATGARIDPRIAPAVWFALVILTGRLAQAVQCHRDRTAMIVGVLVLGGLVAGSAIHIRKEFRTYGAVAARYQLTEERTEAVIAGVDRFPDDGAKVVFVGSAIDGYSIPVPAGSSVVAPPQQERFKSPIQFAGLLYRMGLDREYLLCPHIAVSRCKSAGVDFKFAGGLPNFPKDGSVVRHGDFLYFRLGRIKWLERL